MGAQLVRALFVGASISTVNGFFGGPHRLTRQSHAQRSLSMAAEEPNLLKEQMKEFTEGFGGLFGKPIKGSEPEPVKSTPPPKPSPPPVEKKVEEVVPDVAKIASSMEGETVEVKKEAPVVAPVVAEAVAEPVVVKQPVVVSQPEEVIDEQPMAKKASPPAPKAETPTPAPPAPKVEKPPAPKVVVEKKEPPAPKVEKKDPPVFSNPSPSMVKKEEAGAVAVKDVPIKAASDEKKPDPKEEIVKAQQAVTKSFLSFGTSLNEVNLKQMDAIAAKAVATSVTTKTSEESAKPPAAPAGGYFNFLGGKPEVTTESTPAPKAPVAKAPAPAPVEAPKAGGGFFSFLENKDEKEATPSKPVAKAAPPAAPVAKVSVAPPAAPKPQAAAPVASPSKGGFFSFLESDPTLVPVVTKTTAVKAPAPKVPEKEEESSNSQRQFSVPTIAQARSEASKGPSDASPRSAAPAVQPASPKGGMFDFLKPINNEEVSAPAVVAPKAAPVAPKAPAPAPKVTPAPAAPAASAGGGFFSFLQSSPGVGASSAPPAAPAASADVKPAMAMKAKVSTPAAVAPKATPAPVVKAPAAPAGGGLFSFLQSSPGVGASSAPPAASADVKPAMAMKAKVSTPAAAAAPKASPAPVVKAPAASAGGGLFSFLQSSPGVGGNSAPPAASADVKPAMAMKSKVSTPAAAAKESPAVTGMNPRFLATISKLLKNDASKIKTFQKSTDAFRYGDLSPVEFLSQLEKLFGEGQLDAVVVPLVAELPERDIATQLKTTYQKQVAAESAKRAAEEKKRLDEEKVLAMKKKAADDAARVKAAADAKAAAAKQLLEDKKAAAAASAAAAALKKKQEEEKRAKVVVPVAKVAAPAAKASPIAAAKAKVATPPPAPAAATPARGLFGGMGKKPEPVAPVAPPAPPAKTASFGGGLFGGGAKPKPAAPAPAAPSAKSPPAKSVTSSPSTSSKPPTFFASPKAAVQPPTKK